MGAPKVRWTQEEEDALRKGVKDHGTGRWKHIKHDPKYKEVLNNRSNVDLKDKWRNILVAEGAIEKPSARKGKKRKQQQANEDGGALEATNKTKAEIDQQAQEVMSQAVHNLQAKDNGPTTLTTGGTEAAAHTPLEKVISPGAQTGDESRPKASGGRKEGGGGGGEDSKSERLDFSSLPMEEKVIAARTAEEAMAEAVELEQLVSVKKQQDQEKQQEEQEQEQEGGMNKHEDGSNDQNQVMDQTKPPKKR